MAEFRVECLTHAHSRARPVPFLTSRATNRNHTRLEAHEHQAPVTPRTPDLSTRDMCYHHTKSDALPTELRDRLNSRWGPGPGPIFTMFFSRGTSSIRSQTQGGLHQPHLPRQRTQHGLWRRGSRSLKVAVGSSKFIWSQLIIYSITSCHIITICWCYHIRSIDASRIHVFFLVFLLPWNPTVLRCGLVLELA